MASLTPLQDLEAAEHAYERVRPELEALSVSALSMMNVDVVSATSIALGVSEGILSHRERMAKLPEFEIRHVDNLIDYAKAAWYAYVTNLPSQTEDTTLLMQEVNELRAKLLMWAAPLVGAGLFEAAAVAKIKEGSGHKDAPSDLVALVGLYRSRWDQVKNICGVTEEDLARGAEIGPAVFAAVSRREFFPSNAGSDGSLRVRRAWTLLDRAYAQCRRALQYLRFEEGDADLIAPSLRRNSGPAAKASAPEPSAPDAPGASKGPTAVTAPPPIEATGAIIDAGSPFRAAL